MLLLFKALVRRHRFTLALTLSLVSSVWLTACSEQAGEAPSSQTAETPERALTRDESMALYVLRCASCHGGNAEGNMMTRAPALAAQFSDYTLRQLEHYATGVRGAAPKKVRSVMTTVAMNLSAAQRAGLANYVATLPEAGQPAPRDLARVKQGEKVYQSYCGSCHGSAGQGNEMLQAPNLRLLDPDYFKAQYRAFLSGERGYHDSDRLGKQMRAMAAAMPDPESLDAVVDYLHAMSGSE